MEVRLELRWHRIGPEFALSVLTSRYVTVSEDPADDAP